MKSVEWFKVTSDIFENKKIVALMNSDKEKHIARSSVLVWFQLLALAAKINDHGKIYITTEVPYTHQDLITVLRLPNTKKSELFLNRTLIFLERTSMITEKPCLQILNFDRYQNADALDKIRERWREQKRKSKQTFPPEHPTEALRELEVSVEKDLKEENKNTQKETKKAPDEIVMDGACLAQFDEFWSTYPESRHIGIDDVKNWFKQTKVDPDLFKKIIRSVKEHIAGTNWKDQDGRFIPKPIKFLREAMWLEKVIGAEPFENDEPEMSMEEMKAEIEKNKKEELDKVLKKYKQNPEEQQPCHGSQSTPT